MSELVPFGGGGPSNRDVRQLRRDLSQLGARGRYELARIDQTTELQVAKAEGVAVVAGAAMGAVARATVHAQHLAAAVPAAEPRLVAILDALTVAQIGI